MKKIIRNYVWETNSSATNALIVDNAGLEPSKLPVDADGYILTDFGSFEYGAGEFWSQEDKLSYLVTNCYYLGSWDEDITAEDNYHFEHLEEAICEYTGAKGIRITHKNKDWGIDHQIQPEYDLPLVEEWDPSTIQSFVFNKYVGLLISND